MSIQPNDYDGEIVSNDIRAINGKEYVLLMVKCVDEFEEQIIPVKMWLTPKAIGMARAGLKLCGFDVAKDDLVVLAEDKTYLAGRRVPVEVKDEGKYGLQGSVKLDRVGKKRLGQLTQALRSSDADDALPPPPPSDEGPDPWDVDEKKPETKPANNEFKKLAEEAKTLDEGVPF